MVGVLVDVLVDVRVGVLVAVGVLVLVYVGVVVPFRHGPSEIVSSGMEQ
jgi:hypothetical protein